MGGVRSIGSRKLRLQRRAETLPKKPKQERRPPPEFPAGHGERVWIFNHVTRGHVWFSLYPNFEVSFFLDAATSCELGRVWKKIR